jgi:hypothetical protein
VNNIAENIFWSLPDFYKAFDMAGMEFEATYKTLVGDNEPFE